MIIIVHSKPAKGSIKKQFRVKYTGANNEVLATSEPLKTKQSAWKNIAAMAKHFIALDHSKVLVTDDTIEQQVWFDVLNGNKEIIAK